jgi:hypothetical protein
MVSPGRRARPRDDHDARPRLTSVSLPAQRGRGFTAAEVAYASVTLIFVSLPRVEIVFEC